MASAGSPPSAPDPSTLIQAQEAANRFNVNSPFGSVNWTTGPGGQQTMNQQLSPQMQGMVNQAFANAAAPRQQIMPTEGLSDLTSAILGRVAARYGLGTGNANNPTIMGLQNAPHGGGAPFNSSMSAKTNMPPTPMNPGNPTGMQQTNTAPQAGLQTGVQMPNLNYNQPPPAIQPTTQSPLGY